ncbi:hypothetical protein HQ45_04415 [Porphyromonas crevioricanis]|uniref:DUF4293 domain-containing protein n=2 Tax=Porphyromonas crevioricanis TaxID=393921 RepID=A0A0A2FVQ8_9PORP|nr:DUF4293 domain-containing protein [Porphyromonas crevioricanis]KGN90066.1 hypothetical protein HQ45_04415 [Porphyromonas crevioricanis]KGN94247.1 hypothetical protein HQ38_06915 [Porphyromonas crevioricanis]SJZ69597.1 protein of unknown function [Porphyromonas crevioricanis]SQH72273.1 Uncharacterised protein [Porphyromonas crevioricanis]GAD05102.1 hypothetical protein PORCRE_800 [Porphyromonas crevioricanis JCM 15906]
MWQRIQTLWLLLAGVAMTMLLFLPLAVAYGADTYEITTAGIRSMSAQLVKPTWGLFFVDFLSVLVSFITIFLYKRRILQIRLCVFNILLILGLLVYFAMIAYSFISAEGLSFSFKLWMSLPFVSIILLYLAIRGIGADEAKIRALNRLR